MHQIRISWDFIHFILLVIFSIMDFFYPDRRKARNGGPFVHITKISTDLDFVTRTTTSEIYVILIFSWFVCKRAPRKSKAKHLRLYNVYGSEITSEYLANNCERFSEEITIFPGVKLRPASGERLWK